MHSFISSRKGIPFFHDKTEIEFQQDIYERYHEMVVRQSAIHAADHIWGAYPFQEILTFADKHYPKEAQGNILEIGCGVGRWIASLAERYPESTCWGIDFSYQMLKQAARIWVEGKDVEIDLTGKGLSQHSIKGHLFKNLHFGLAKAEKLPFESDTQNIIVNSFLLDRLEDPRKGFEEMYRVLATSGKMMVVSPLNFKKQEHWNIYYPPSQLSSVLKEIGFKVLDWKEDLIVDEPLDHHGNLMRWKCLAFVVEK